MQLVTAVLDRSPRIENRSLIENLQLICQSGLNAYNQLMPASCYASFQACLLRFLAHVTFGDNDSAAFELCAAWRIV